MGLFTSINIAATGMSVQTKIILSSTTAKDSLKIRHTEDANALSMINLIEMIKHSLKVFCW